MTYDPVAQGELAAVVTFLEMRERPRRPVPPSDLSLRCIERPRPDAYRHLFRRVGGRWLWFSRLTMTDAKLEAIISDPQVELYAVENSAGQPAGLLELDLREAGQCELAFLGLVPELAGQGHGTWLLGKTLDLAWRPGVERVHVHTCTLDHPAALRAYISAGFTAYRRAIERFPDPRLLGILPADCAPQVPLVGKAS